MAQKISFKLRRILILRVGILAALAWGTVVITSIILEQSLIKSALTKEAEYFWARHSEESNAIPPDTWNLKSLLKEGDRSVGSLGDATTSMTALLDDIDSGFVSVPDQPGYTLIYKTQSQGKELYLLFDGENVRKLAFFLGIIPLTLFLLLSYLVGFIFYKRATKALSPIMWLADKFEQFDPLNSSLPEFNLKDMPKDADWETSVLASSLGDYLERIKSFVGRERAFTRDVSHELRTPLTVVGMAVNMLELNGNLDDKDTKAVNRIRNAASDMLELVEVFLILARESSKDIKESKIWVAEIAQSEIDKNQNLLENKSVTASVEKQSELTLNASEKIIEVLLGNLIRNAMIYTEEGIIAVSITASKVIVKDTGVGMSAEQVEQIFEPFFRGGTRPSGGFGVGLTIVKRITDRFDWKVSVVSELGLGTQITVDFSKSVAE